MVLIEAASFGLPALVSDVPGSGMSWVVQNEETGMVVKNNDVADIVRAINKIQKSPDLLPKWSLKAKKRFDKLFQISSVATMTLEHYTALINHENDK